MKDRVVVVTGAGRGIGRAVCERFGQAGATVVAAARSAGPLVETKASIEARGGRCHVHATDVCAADELDGLFEEVMRRFGRVDVLVNNAGVAPLAKLDDLDMALFRSLMAVNVEAVYHACRRVWPMMREQGGGVIVNISSIASFDPFPGFAAYGASKAWVNAWSKSLAEEGRAHGIRVFAVAPGAVETRMLRDVFPNFPNDQALDASEVANVVFALSQPDCRYATGAVVVVKK